MPPGLGGGAPGRPVTAAGCLEILSGPEPEDGPQPGSSSGPGRNRVRLPGASAPRLASTLSDTNVRENARGAADLWAKGCSVPGRRWRPDRVVRGSGGAARGLLSHRPGVSINRDCLRELGAAGYDKISTVTRLEPNGFPLATSRTFLPASSAAWASSKAHCGQSDE